MSVREPLRLTLHHTPLLLCFALLGEPGAARAVLDPSLLEERVSSGALLLALNAQRDLCAMHKAGGLPITHAQLAECLAEAALQAPLLASSLAQALAAHEAARASARVRRHAPGAALVLGSPLPLPHEDDGEEAAAAMEPQRAWDDPVELPRGTGFPFSGPLHPDRLAEIDGGEDEVATMEEHAAAEPRVEPARAAPLAAEPTSLFDAVKRR